MLSSLSFPLNMNVILQGQWLMISEAVLMVCWIPSADMDQAITIIFNFTLSYQIRNLKFLVQKNILIFHLIKRRKLNILGIDNKSAQS